jgi:hypothetical protein
VGAGMHRVSWDLRYAEPTLMPEKPSEGDEDFPEGPRAPMVMPGAYSAEFAKQVGGAVTPIGTPQSFSVKILQGLPGNAEDRVALMKFQQQVAALYRSLNGAEESVKRLKERLGDIKRAILQTAAAPPAMIERANAIEAEQREIQRALVGDEVLRARQDPIPVSINGRVTTIMDEQRLSGSKPTGTHLEQYKIASDQLAEQLAKLRTLVEVDLPKLESDMEKAGAPWTPGRLPVWPEQPK